MDYEKLAELLFPHIDKTPEEIEAMYPPRELPEGAKVTRLGPSPTGFIHLGNLYGAFVDERLAHQSGGTFYLRIEDTDDKRYVEGAVETITSALKFFDINFDEGAEMEGGAYGPYYQSQRGEIYQTFVKDLVKRGQAYPCFLTEEELAEIRAEQEAAKVTTGIYGEYARCRDLTYEEIEANIAAGKPYVIRIKSKGNQVDPAHCCHESGAACTTRSGAKCVNHDGTMYIHVNDAIRGEVAMPANDQDVIILKATGIPTYHFAHVVDDHLMRTTHVVRGEEWLMSLPIHVELFDKCGFPLPTYCHTAVLMKIDEETGGKRKLSKRKDPELSLDYYRNEGYHPQAVKEYLLTILNSNFEEWRMANPDASIDEFEFTTEKMSSGGALFDLDKLNDVSKDVLLKIPAAELAEFMAGWAAEFRPELAPLFDGSADASYGPEYLAKILDLGRDGKKPRKDLIYAKQIFEFIRYFYDDYFVIEEPVPEEVSDEDAREILQRYLDSYDHSDDQSQWFDKIRAIAVDLGYAAKPKDFKKHPEDYKGHVGHVSTVIRLAVMGRTQSPDVWEIQQILGEERTRARIEALLI
ncbi:MAG: glutamate--tRNA ligase [Firmicutes bacterium]|nr:glutamate--tRNA ligase [Bacillota bacterium]